MHSCAYLVCGITHRQTDTQTQPDGMYTLFDTDRYVYLYMTVSIHTCIHDTHSLIYICMCMHMHGYTYVCVCICMGIHMYGYTYVWVYICMGIHMYVYAYAWVDTHSLTQNGMCMHRYVYAYVWLDVRMWMSHV
jgi:hypothetical protein